ncbi:MAG: 3'(2'),5'-bisphosphate nucleotidase CysQ [Ectothiorhodospiraceae bacterium]|nr:3'(2'),5'-bisphosphate nucleotidase CysQ [Chromatiales bacterium]MCP5153744.1 3'(2'),5'-bisphosphate nucleotidase CysQ [Ectothiorhodospiraceae bacterium]
MKTIDPAALVGALTELAERAGREILAIYSRDIEVRDKADHSPVTDADERAERIILQGLAALAPDVPVVAEEAVAAGVVPDVSGGRFFLVDPLDGTREFISRNGEFTVNIALVENGRPSIGVVHLPALDATYWTDGRDGAWRRLGPEPGKRIACRAPGDGLVVVASRSHRDAQTDAYLADFEVAELISAGSSLKLCRVAEGSADMYPRLGRTMEWDIAAGQAVLQAAGGSVTTLAGEPLTYGKPGFDNPHFVARGLPRATARAEAGPR